MFKILIAAFLFILSIGPARAQWVQQSSGAGVRFRGVSAVDAKVAWASGEKGTYARTTDGGKTWRAATVPGAEDMDFRDVDAFDEQTAYLLSIGEGDKSRIYKTTDGGRRWTLQFKSARQSAFFDAMAFWDRDHGVALSDPVDGRFIIITTSNGGRTWVETPAAGMPAALPGEGAFAASGTCIAVQGKSNLWFGTGGPSGARIFRSTNRGRTWAAATTPLTSGKTAGVFSVAFRDAKHGVVAGGDYAKEGEASNNIAITKDGGATWRVAGGPRPNGYRSCVAVLRAASAFAFVTVGPTGSEYSLDGGETWAALGADGYHSVSFAGRDAGWAVGEGGRVAGYAGSISVKSQTHLR